MRPIRFMLVFAVAALTSAHAQSPDILTNIRLATRFGDDRILIQGGTFREAFDHRQCKALPGETHLYPPSLFIAAPDASINFHETPSTTWRSGDRWTLFAGAGAPVPIGSGAESRGVSRGASG